jgi:hypothetical protein
MSSVALRSQLDPNLRDRALGHGFGEDGVGGRGAAVKLLQPAAHVAQNGLARGKETRARVVPQAEHEECMLLSQIDDVLVEGIPPVFASQHELGRRDEVEKVNNR